MNEEVLTAAVNRYSETQFLKADDILCDLLEAYKEGTDEHKALDATRTLIHDIINSID